MGGDFSVFDTDSLWQKYTPNRTLRFNARSIYFEVMATQGFSGLAIFVMISAIAFRYGNWVISRTKVRPDLFWGRDVAAMTQCSLVGFIVGAAFLNRAFFDPFWHLIAILFLVQTMVKRELETAQTVAVAAVSSTNAPARASVSGAIAAPSTVRSFLHRSAPRAESKSFLRQR